METTFFPAFELRRNAFHHLDTFKSIEVQGCLVSNLPGTTHPYNIAKQLRSDDKNGLVRPLLAKMATVCWIFFALNAVLSL